MGSIPSTQGEHTDNAWAAGRCVRRCDNDPRSVLMAAAGADANQEAIEEQEEVEEDDSEKDLVGGVSDCVGVKESATCDAKNGCTWCALLRAPYATLRATRPRSATGSANSASPADGGLLLLCRAVSRQVCGHGRQRGRLLPRRRSQDAAQAVVRVSALG